jgi:hypothetical protein
MGTKASLMVDDDGSPGGTGMAMHQAIHLPKTGFVADLSSMN